jgi:4-amino-4-deoxy-L-arabinose transferase-like glycosyltransferase
MSALRLRDAALLAACCAVLSAFPLLFNRTLSTHETTHCQNVREMRSDGDWVIPHYGGRPWLERPPLPFWLTIPVIELFGDRPATYRLASALVGAGCVLLVAWIASLWYGRAVGLLSGLALATLRQFNHYAAGPEAEIFLCAVVTAAMALFVHLEFRLRPAEGEPWLVGRRPWALLAFFVVLGLTNLVKGLFFGDAFILLPIAAYLLCGEKPLALVRRYVWLPGWLAFAVCGAAWAVAAYVRHPDVVELWFSDYGGRLNQGFMREPAYYYLLHLPWAIFPWSLLAFAALALTWRAALTQGRTPERFLWCWALVPLAFLSIPQGKHQHYLLPALAPWAILGALGGVRLWGYLREAPWFSKPWPALLALAVPGDAAIYFLARRHSLPIVLLEVALIAWPTLVLLAWFSLSRKNRWAAAAAAFALLAVVSWTLHAQPRLLHDRYADDRAFVRSVQDRVPADATLLVLDDWGPLDASWLLFHLGRGKLLHNVTFLRDERVGGPEVYVVARRHRAKAMAAFGPCERLFESASSRGEPSPDYRLGLYRLRIEAARQAGPVYVSPMQATGRRPGPWLADPDQRSQSSPAAGFTASAGR